MVLNRTSRNYVSDFNSTRSCTKWQYRILVKSKKRNNPEEQKLLNQPKKPSPKKWKHSSHQFDALVRDVLSTMAWRYVRRKNWSEMIYKHKYGEQRVDGTDNLAFARCVPNNAICFLMRSSRPVVAEIWVQYWWLHSRASPWEQKTRVCEYQRKLNPHDSRFFD